MAWRFPLIFANALGSDEAAGKIFPGYDFAGARLAASQEKGTLEQIPVIGKIGSAVANLLPVVGPIALGAIYGMGAVSLGLPGAAGSAVVSRVTSGSRSPSLGSAPPPLPQQNSAPYGVGGQVYSQSRDPFYLPYTPVTGSDYTESGGSAGSAGPYTPGDSSPAYKISPLNFALISLAILGILYLMMRR
jgi:hypothetical protein